MQAERTIGHAPRTQALARDLENLQGPCVGCPGCLGICQALFDAIQSQPKNYQEREDFVEIFAKFGVSEEEFMAVFDASGFRKISKVEEQVKATWKIEGNKISFQLGSYNENKLLIIY